jgi:hypothetical protein
MATYVYNTFGNVIDEAYDILSVDGDSNTFPGLSRTNFEKFANRFNKEFIDSVRMRTREGTYPFATVADTALNDASAAAGDTTVTILSSTGWPASGLCLIDNVPMTFTRSGLVLTVPALQRAFDDAATVQLAYAVPTDYWRAQGMFIGETPFTYQRRGDEQNVLAQHYALYGDYFVLPKDTTGGQDVLVHYYQKPTATLTAADTMDIMDLWDDYLIKKLVAHGHGVMYDDQRKAIWNADAEITKKKARSHFAKLDGSLANAFIPSF